MSYVTVLNDAASRADAASTKAEGASNLLFDIVNGPQDTFVTTASGSVPTAATAIEDLRSQITAGTLAPISESVTLSTAGQVNITFVDVQTSGIAVYVDEGGVGTFYRYFNFTIDGTSSIILGDSFASGTVVWGVSQEIGGDVQTAVNQTQANAQLAEDWAILTTGTVDGVEYSSKYHAGQASTSASNAATSESNATTSASNAATSESNAATSASNAATSETNALASKNAARTSEVNAASSESNAATSELNASNSASDAQAARDAAISGASVYTSIANGLAGTVDGESFRVIETPTSETISMYKNNAGTEQLLGTYYTSVGVDKAREDLSRLDVKLSRSLQKIGDQEQTLHSHFAYRSFGKGTRETYGVEKAVSSGGIYNFTRASTGTYFDANGVLQTALSDEMRFDHDPATGKPRGVLIEESRTNLLTYSEAFDNAAWVLIQASIVADAATSPGGATTADKLVKNDGEVTAIVRQLKSVTAGLKYTLSVFAKAAEFNQVRLSGGGSLDSMACVFDLSIGSVVSSSAVSESIKDVGGGWFKCACTMDAVLTGTVYVNYYAEDGMGDGTSGIYIWGAQVEEASTASSYIPTAGTSVTRVADAIPINDFSNWKYSKGTFHMKSTNVESSDLFTFDGIPIIEDASGSGTVTYAYDVDTDTAEVYVDGTLVYELGPYHLVDIETLTEFLMSNGGLSSNTHLRYFPYKMTASEVQSL